VTIAVLVTEHPSLFSSEVDSLDGVVLVSVVLDDDGDAISELPKESLALVEEFSPSVEPDDCIEGNKIASQLERTHALIRIM
jgi:hypothetical protein